jgi:uncharacterized protein DUF2786
VNVRNRERRKSKQKAREQRRRHDRNQLGRTIPRQVTPVQLAEMLISSAVHAQHHDDAEEVQRCARLLADQLDGSEGWRPVDRVLLACLQRGVADAWRRGWQPNDLAGVAARQLSARHVRLVSDAVAGQMRTYPSATVDRRWDEQVRSLGATAWWEPDGEYLERWGRREGVDRAAVITFAVEVLCLLDALPEIPLLCPLPGTGRRRPTDTGPGVEPRILEKVRALLAKAESTEFPEEAEALTAKAQEFMARHSIDAALLAATSAVRDEPGGCRIGIDAPYEASKALLLQEVAEANRCRVVWSRQLGFATVIGFDGDLQAVELLYMSLLVQVTTAVVRAGSRRTVLGRSRTRSFRQSFLSAFAVRIGQRLRLVADDATREAGASGTNALLPVLAARDESVQEKVDAHFPGLVHRAVGMTDREGWASGTAAADQAVIHAGAGYLRAD